MAMIMFPCVKVCDYTDENGIPVGPLKIVNGPYGKILYFRASEKYGYGDKIQYKRYDFCVYENETPKLLERIEKMKIKCGSYIEVSGAIQPLKKTINGSSFIDIAIKVYNVNYTTERPAKEKNDSPDAAASSVPVYEDEFPATINLDEKDFFS